MKDTRALSFEKLCRQFTPIVLTTAHCSPGRHVYDRHETLTRYAKVNSPLSLLNRSISRSLLHQHTAYRGGSLIGLFLGLL
jgi:hypothetical protein